MKAFYTILALSAMASLTSCISVGKQSFIVNPEYNPEKTIKIVAVNTNDVILGRLEHHLVENGLAVISDNYLRGAVPNGSSVTVQSSDTTYTLPQFHPVTLKLFDQKPADYILRYEYNEATLSTNKRAFSYFNARLINVETGAFDASFTFTQGNLGWGKHKADNVLSMFARSLAGE